MVELSLSTWSPIFSTPFVGSNRRLLCFGSMAGHSCGHQVLKHVAGILLQQFRDMCETVHTRKSPFEVFTPDDPLSSYDLCFELACADLLAMQETTAIVLKPNYFRLPLPAIPPRTAQPF